MEGCIYSTVYANELQSGGGKFLSEDSLFSQMEEKFLVSNGKYGKLCMC